MICAQVHSKHEVQYKNVALLDDFYQLMIDLWLRAPEAILYCNGDYVRESEYFILDRKHLQECTKNNISFPEQSRLVIQKLLDYSDERHNEIYVDVRD